MPPLKKSRDIKDHRLEDLEHDFPTLLISCLRECASGRWGLFGQNDHLEASIYLQWPEATRLKEIAQEIHDVRLSFGQPNPLCERFLHYCTLRGSNVPGEPKLAKALLLEMNSD
jgi:hypothetical protein